LWCALLLSLPGLLQAQARSEPVGAAIYRRGVLAGGAPLLAARDGGLAFSGAAAACANCHRRSGLGAKEGRQSVPPIAGSYLFNPRAGTTDDLDLPFVDGMQADRDPYTETTLARAIRAGLRADGTPLSYLMPRYTLGDADMGQLIGYLKSLSPGAVPGVSQSVLHFATVVTPDSDPIKRQGVLDVLRKFFIDKNHYVRSDGPRLRSSRRMMFKVNRHWELHVWELSGPSSTWETQLRANLAREPVFAVISGIGGKTWAPIHRFCEDAALPCLFPNVDVPVVAEGDFDSLYLSKGLLLEAGLMAQALTGRIASGDVRRVVQVYRATDAGEAGAASLAASLGAKGLTVINQVLPATSHPGDVAAAIARTGAGDALVLWLRAADIGALADPPTHSSGVFMSGRMGGLEQAPLPGAWRAITRLAYPFDLPQRRRVRLDYPLGWFRIRGIPVVALPEQADTYLACGIVSDALNHMVDTFVRDYLVERVEGMLEHRDLTGYYPRLSLAPGQRFASKGGYLVRFAAPTGSNVLADGEWITP
jgi:hypothetical protein